MHLMSRLIGLSLLTLMILFTLALGGKMGIYLDIPSIVLIVGALIGGSLMCFSVGQLQDALTAAVLGPDAPRVPARQQQTRAAVFGRLYLLSWGSGLVGTLIGVIAMLSDLSDPASIGSGLAVALLTSLYGAGLAELVFGPMQQTVMNQPPLEDEPDTARGSSPVPAGQQSSIWKGTAVIAFIVSMMGVVVASVPGGQGEAADVQQAAPGVDREFESLSLVERLELNPPVFRTGRPEQSIE